MQKLPKLYLLLLFVVFAAALAIRLYDLDDLPLDFHPTRQLFSMLKARGMYYAISPELPAWQREIAIQQWQDSMVIEPPILEGVVALSYRAFGENLAIPRLYSIFFWLVGGFFLFLLASQVSNFVGGLLSLLFYLFLPYATLASRSFQPDPLMVMLIIAAAWAMWNWRETPTLKWAIAAGLLNGAAIFIKNVAVFPLLGLALALVLERGLVASLKDRQTWLVAALSVFPVAVYTLYGMFVADFLGSQFRLRFFPNLWVDPSFYLRWKGMLDGIVGFGPLVLGVIGVLISQRRRVAALLLGLWLGYMAYSFTFAYHTISHDYYHLMFIPILALSLAPVAETLYQRIPSHRFLQAVLATLVILTVALQIWDVRVTLARYDYRPDQAYWVEIGNAIGPSATPVVAMAQDYGTRLAYWGWQPVVSWLTDGDLSVRSLAGIEVNELGRFEEMIEGKHFFVVTQLTKLEEQPTLQSFLFENYPIYAQGKGYIIFDISTSNKNNITE
jgi:4-amino-4-deoxy-L-arabinose transferase-like glycosyltransferase